jgi:hypothetical protein
MGNYYGASASGSSDRAALHAIPAAPHRASPTLRSASPAFSSIFAALHLHSTPAACPTPAPAALWRTRRRPPDHQIDRQGPSRAGLVTHDCVGGVVGEARVVYNVHRRKGHTGRPPPPRFPVGGAGRLLGSSERPLGPAAVSARSGPARLALAVAARRLARETGSPACRGGSCRPPTAARVEWTASSARHNRVDLKGIAGGATRPLRRGRGLRASAAAAAAAGRSVVAAEA